MGQVLAGIAGSEVQTRLGLVLESRAWWDLSSRPPFVDAAPTFLVNSALNSACLAEGLNV